MHRMLGLAPALVATLVLAAGATATDTFEDPPDLASSSDAVGPSTTELAIPITPDPSVLEPRPHAWERVVVSGDGRTLDVYFWMGIEPCNGLHSVNVTPSASGHGIDLTLMTGTPAAMEPGTACIEIARAYVTAITLEQPLITQSLE